MRRLLLATALLLAATLGANAQCVAVGGVNSVPQTGVNCQSEPNIGTYGATGVGIVPAASATDVACITGSASKIVRVQYIRVSGSSGTLVNVPVTITKHVSANTGGTPAATTALPVPYTLDTLNPAVSATTISWTANPTIVDAAPGIIDNDILAFVTTGTTSTNAAVIFDYTARNFNEAPTLRGITQQLCVNLNAITVTTGLLNVTFRWTEATQ